MDLHIPDWVIQSIPFLIIGGISAGVIAVYKKFMGKGFARRRDDDLMNKLMDQNREMFDRFLEAYRENTGTLQGSINALRALSGEIQAVSQKQSASEVFVQNSFRGVHERLDILVGKP